MMSGVNRTSGARKRAAPTWASQTARWAGAYANLLAVRQHIHAALGIAVDLKLLLAGRVLSDVAGLLLHALSP
jgi:hypothetical protein